MHYQGVPPPDPNPYASPQTLCGCDRRFNWMLVFHILHGALCFGGSCAAFDGWMGGEYQSWFVAISIPAMVVAIIMDTILFVETPTWIEVKR